MKNITKECCICRQWLDSKDNWYTPTVSERRRQYELSEDFKITHTYCHDCVSVVKEVYNRDLILNKKFGLSKLV